MQASDDSTSSELGRVHVHHAENLEFLRATEDGSFELIYVDPPFNTGRVQARKRLRTERVKEGGDRVGFGAKQYKTTVLGELAFGDQFDDYLSFLGERLVEARRVLTDEGSLFLHLDPREAHYAKVLLDRIFGRECFQNEIIWAYDFGGRSKSRWSAKHDTIFWYSKHPKRYTYDYDAIDRIPYMAPGLVGPEKARRGKTPTDVWWHTIVSPTGREKTGYPTQKPLGVIKRIINVHSRRGDRVLDFFAGSGTTGEAAARAGRSAVLVDQSADALRVMRERLAFCDPTVDETRAPSVADSNSRTGARP